MGWLSHLLRRVRDHALGARLSEALRRHEDAVERLDSAVREVLGK